MVSLARDQRTNDGDGQAQDGDRDGLLVLDGLRRHDAFDRTDDHHHCHAEQEDGAGEASEDLDFPGAESEARIVRAAA